jgi:Asp-tRNA(Asn)/Glu-tRNA(Gln) amidotransferase A subunit family amidase
MRQGRLTSEQLVRSCLDHIARREPLLHAWAVIDGEAALAAARALDGEPARGALHGVPIGVKDIIDTAALPTAYNSPIYRGHRPSVDAAVVERARRAGLVLLGKTATQEFATRGDAGPTRHPLSATHSPGGSSNGSAVAVADCMVPLAISTQTAGSIVRPASYCGVVGFKPSFGLIDPSGMRRLVPSFDTVGIHARSVADAALALGALSHWHGLETCLSGACTGLRFAVCRTHSWSLASPAMRGALDHAVARLAAHGPPPGVVELPPVFALLNVAHDTISDAEARQALDVEWRKHRDGLSPGVQAKLRRGEAVSAEAYRQALRTVEHCRTALDDIFAGSDCLLTPSAPDVAPPFSRTETGDSAFNKPWSSLGTPSINLPVPAAGRMPLGVQLVAAPGHDTQLLRAAERLQRLLADPATAFPTVSFPNYNGAKHEIS